MHWVAWSNDVVHAYLGRLEHLLPGAIWHNDCTSTRPACGFVQRIIRSFRPWWISSTQRHDMQDDMQPQGLLPFPLGCVHLGKSSGHHSQFPNQQSADGAQFTTKGRHGRSPEIPEQGQQAVSHYRLRLRLM